MLKTGVYFQLAPVLFGTGTIAQAGSKAKEIHISKALVVSDAGVEAAGHVATLLKTLEQESVEYVVWAKAEKDCPDSTVREAAALARQEKVDGIIGIGGGSVLDTAKAVAAVAVNGDEVLQEIVLYLTGQKQYAVHPLALLEIPTTSGTGSESTFVSVVTSTEMDCKIGLPVLPDYGIVDPALTLTASGEITGFTGMDALAHAVESLTEEKNTAHSDLLAYEAIRLIHENLPKAVENGQDLEAREKMALASNLAGISFNESGTHFGHASAHAIGHKYHLDHGVCCANMLPAVVWFTAKEYPEKIQKLGEIFGVSYDKNENPEEIGTKTADAIRSFGKSAGVATFSEKGLSAEEIISVAEQVDADHLAHCYGGSLNGEDIRVILEKAFA